MFKRLLSTVIAFIYVCALSFNAAAFENESLLEYYNTDSTMTVYVGNIGNGEVSCRIAGKDCAAENIGDIYSNAEKYKTLFLIDSSTSMRHYSKEISDFLLSCIDKKQDNEYYSIAVFAGSTYSNIIDFESSQYKLEKAVDEIKYDAQSSYIYDNVDKAVKNLINDGDKCYERVVLFTDGCENSATGINIEELNKTISDNPVQVYTVTFVNSRKDNYEMLKKTAWIARTSNAADIQVNDTTDIKKAADILFNDAKDIFRIDIQLENSVADGSRKAIVIVSGNTAVKGEIETPMLDAPAPVHNEETGSEETTTVSQTETTAEVTTIKAVTTAPAELSSEKSRLLPMIVIVAATAAVIIAVIIVLIVIIGKKKKNKSAYTPAYTASASDNDDTVIITSSGGDTEMFFDDDRSSAFVIILRDIASTDHTFEAPLSSDVIVGRSSDVSSLVIDYDKSVSKRHCKIFTKGSEVYIEDLGSANKTFVNDVQISSPHIIKNADEIKIGRVKFKVTIK